MRNEKKLEENQPEHKCLHVPRRIIDLDFLLLLSVLLLDAVDAIIYATRNAKKQA